MPMAHRVIQWATGNVGKQAARGVLAHPDLELVGCWVHGEAKEGRDVGEICDVGCSWFLRIKGLKRQFGKANKLSALPGGFFQGVQALGAIRRPIVRGALLDECDSHNTKPVAEGRNSRNAPFHPRMCVAHDFM